MKGRILFQEEQSFRYTWSWWLIMIITAPVLGIMTWGYIQQLEGSSDYVMLIVTGVTYLIMFGVVWLFWVMKLVIKVDEGAVFYSFFPFVRSEKSVRKNDVSKIYVRKYNPLWEYGGWGYRIRIGKGKAYNINGKWGLQLQFQNEKKLLLGTQKPEELEKAITELKRNWGVNESYG